MPKLCKRIIALYLALCLVFCSFHGVFASDESYTAQHTPTVWEYIISTTGTTLRTLFNSVVGVFVGNDYCAFTSSGKHEGTEVVSKSVGSNGEYVFLIRCTGCGDTFVYRGSDAESQYNDALHDNNLDNGLSVTPEGGFYWYPTFSQVNPIFVAGAKMSSGGGSLYFDYRSSYDSKYYSLSDFESRSVAVHFEPSMYVGLWNYISFDTFTCSPPIAGTFVCLSTPACELFNYPSRSFSFSSGSFSFSSYRVAISTYLFPYTLHLHPPVFSVTPSSSFSAPSVPSSITINNNTYPVIDIDFNSRTVHVTDDRTIIYDDDHITIKEGDTVIQTINYIIEDDDPGTDPGNGDDSSTPADPGTVDPGDASGSGGSGCCEQCALLLRQVNSYLLQIQTLVDQINDKLGPESDNYMEGIYNLLVEINTALDNLPTEPHKDYEAKLTAISNQLANIWGDLDDIKTSLSAVQSNTATFNQKLDTVHADLQAVLAELQTQRGILSQILSVLQDLLRHVTSIDSNVEELANEEDSQNFFDSFILKFHFIGDIFSIIRQLFADITNDAATVTFVDNGDLPIGDLSNQHFPVSGSPVPVGTAPQVLIKFPSDTYHGADLSGYSAIDMSWYAPYKSRVDALISGFLWIGYLWLLFKRAPGIVRGAAMIEETNYKIEDWKNGG